MHHSATTLGKNQNNSSSRSMLTEEEEKNSPSQKIFRTGFDGPAPIDFFSPTTYNPVTTQLATDKDELQLKSGEEEEELPVQGKGISVNDSPALEKEADVMGEKVAKGNSGFTFPIHGLNQQSLSNEKQTKTIQAKSINDYKDPSKPEFDPSKISDSEIMATDEYQYLLANFVRVPYRFTPDGALLATRLALRKIRTGVAFDVKTEGIDIMLQANKQLEVLEKSKTFNNKLQWSVQDPTLQGTEFGKWLLAGGAEPNETSGIMNCWELVLFSAYKTGNITQSKLTTIYSNFVSKFASASLADANSYFEKEITTGSENIYKPGDKNSPVPLPGDIVFFKTLVSHTAISKGKNNTSGEVEVMSLWTPNSLKTENTTIENLLKITNGPVRFYSSNW